MEKNHYFIKLFSIQHSWARDYISYYPVSISIDYLATLISTVFVVWEISIKYNKFQKQIKKEQTTNFVPDLWVFSWTRNRSPFIDPEYFFFIISLNPIFLLLSLILQIATREQSIIWLAKRQLLRIMTMRQICNTSIFNHYANGNNEFRWNSCNVCNWKQIVRLIPYFVKSCDLNFKNHTDAVLAFRSQSSRKFFSSF